MKSRRLPLAIASGLTATGLAVAGCGASHSSAQPVSAGGTITIGTLYASTGSYAQNSMPEYQGLRFWANQANANGGIYVAPLKRKEKVKIVAYNDQSDATTAATFYTQLITQDKADVLVSDFGSVLTAPAITIATEQHQLLFDVSGTGTSFFTKPNPYVVLTSLPVSSVWPKPLGKLLLQLKAKRVAILYCQNDFDAAQADAIKGFLAAGGVTPVYDQGVPTTQTDYSTLLASIKATNPDAVLEFGYPNNDTAFLSEVKALGLHFPFLMTVFPGQGPAPYETTPGPATMDYTYTYAAPPILAINKVNSGLSLDGFLKAFAPGQPASSVSFLSIAGYNAGLAIQAAFAHASTMTQLGIRAGVTAASGHLATLEGPFQVNDTGAQIGEPLPVAQAFPSGSGFTFKIVFPASASQTAEAAPSYPAPAGH